MVTTRGQKRKKPANNNGQGSQSRKKINCKPITKQALIPILNVVDPKALQKHIQEEDTFFASGMAPNNARRLYKKLLHQHHPNKGGSTKNFQKIIQNYKMYKQGTKVIIEEAKALEEQIQSTYMTPTQMTKFSRKTIENLHKTMDSCPKTEKELSMVFVEGQNQIISYNAQNAQNNVCPNIANPNIIVCRIILIHIVYFASYFLMGELQKCWLPETESEQYMINQRAHRWASLDKFYNSSSTMLPGFIDRVKLFVSTLGSRTYNLSGLQGIRRRQLPSVDWLGVQWLKTLFGSSLEMVGINKGWSGVMGSIGASASITALQVKVFGGTSINKWASRVFKRTVSGYGLQVGGRFCSVTKDKLKGVLCKRRTKKVNLGPKKRAMKKISRHTGRKKTA